MFQKSLKVVTAFGVLLAGFIAYGQIFAVVARVLGQPYRARTSYFLQIDSKTKKEAIDLATRAHGSGHWSADRDLPVRYYNHERGYWMYARSYDRDKEGKRVKFKPFSLNWVSRDGKSLKAITSDEAVIDLSEPLGLPGTSKSSGSAHVVHARIEGNVRVRDDKGTPDDPSDDLLIGPLPYAEYDEPSLLLTSESDVVIQDRDMRITGFGLRIELRPKEGAGTPGGPGGFEGAKTAYINKNVHIIMSNVGRAGILPGQARMEQSDQGKTPMDVRSAGPMRVELPKPRPAVRVGPPAPTAPTLVFFSRDVVVLRGKVGQPPDQLNCDNLRLTLLPAAGGPTAPGAAATEPDGAGTELALREARATGHAVWLQSKAQGITARCNELIHKKLLPREPDETYFRGDQTTQLRIEKVDTIPDGPDKGKVQSVTLIRTVDATLFEDGQREDSSTVVARGPGYLETRPARDRPVERKATWQDHLIMVTAQAAGRLTSRKITLTGRPELIDPAQATLDARKTIVIWLKPKPKPKVEGKVAVAAPAASGDVGTLGAGSNESFQIEKLVALDEVHLTAPGKTMTARDKLDAVFEAQPAAPTPKGLPDPAPAQTPAAAPGAALAANEGTATTPPDDKPGARSDEARAVDKPADPDIHVEANHVWTRIALREKPAAAKGAARPKSSAPGMTSDSSDVQEVRLRGGVVFHQDPAPGKAEGTDVTGEALDLNNLGNGKSRFTVDYRLDPSAPPPATDLALLPHARVKTEEMTITGPRIGLNQETDQAWVLGPGTLTQMAERGLLTDKEPGQAAPARPAPKPLARGDAAGTKRPLTISWKDKMWFYGRSNDVVGEPVAKAEFYRDVRAVMENEALLTCKKKMETYMDRTVALARPPRGAQAPDAPPAAAEPKPQIVLIRCFEDVLVVSRKVDPATGSLLQQQQIEGGQVNYDKSTGDFKVPGPGIVHLWNREDPAPESGASSAPGVARRPIKPAASPARPAANTRRATAVVGRGGGALPEGAAARGRARVKALPPLKLTKIAFSKGMYGRYIAGKDSDTTEIRWANFQGDVQALNAKVADTSTTIDFERPPDDFMFLTAQSLRVIAQPTPGASSSSRNFLKAWEDALARTRAETISADVITYDSSKELFYAYSNEGRDVTIAQEANPGQPASFGHGDTVQYNRKTGESQVMNPKSIQLVDAKTGSRPGPAPDPKVTPPKSPRTRNMIPGRSTTERKGMMGR